jgi:hypothetical protein
VKPTEEFGWVYSSPASPEKKCRWCNVENVEVNGVVVCATCDFLHNWPNVPKVEA